eukprot:6212709-Pleurochrysis_carterae.AAC.2
MAESYRKLGAAHVNSYLCDIQWDNAIHIHGMRSILAVVTSTIGWRASTIVAGFMYDGIRVHR